MARHGRGLALNFAILSAGDLLGRAVMMIAFVYLARTLGPEGYGAVEVVLSVIMILTVIVDMGLAVVGAREVARQPAQVEPLATRIVSLEFALAAGICALVAVVALLWPGLAATLRTLLIGYTATLLLFPFILGWVFQGRNEMEWVAAPTLARQLLFAALVLALVHAPGHVTRMPLIEMIGAVVAAALSVSAYRRRRWRLKLDLRRAVDLPLIREAWPIGGSNLTWVVRMYLPLILLGAVAGQSAAGTFAAGHRVVMVFQALLALYFINLFPTMSQAAQRSRAGLRSLLGRSMLVLVLPCLLLSLAVTLLAPLGVRIVLGAAPVWQATAASLAVLVWLIPALALRNHARYALTALGRQRADFVCSVAGIGLLLACFFPLTAALGGVGTAWAMLIAEVAATGMTWWVLRPGLASGRAVAEAELPHSI
jgi:polysaccharide transporter, PST family